MYTCVCDAGMLLACIFSRMASNDESIIQEYIFFLEEEGMMILLNSYIISRRNGKRRKKERKLSKKLDILEIGFHVQEGLLLLQIMTILGKKGIFLKNILEENSLSFSFLPKNNKSFAK